MKKLLHIIATPRGELSRTLQVSNAFLDEILNQNSYQIEKLNLFESNLPVFSGQKAVGKYELMQGEELSEKSEESWAEILRLITHFLSFDAYLFSVPMWNFSIPYVLKQYIDLIFQPNYMFAYTQNGPKGLAENKKALIVTSRGGDYSTGTAKLFDNQEPYFKTALPFIGLTDLTFVHAQPMDAGGKKLQLERIKKAQKKVIAIAKTF